MRHHARPGFGVQAKPDMSYFDLHYACQTDGEFRYELSKLATEMERLERYADERGGGTVATLLEECIQKIVMLCQGNTGFLVPYFFPQYPKTEPMSLLDRPFSFALFDFRIGGYTAIRASRQIGKCLERSNLLQIRCKKTGEIKTFTAGEFFDLVGRKAKKEGDRNEENHPRPIPGPTGSQKMLPDNGSAFNAVAVCEQRPDGIAGLQEAPAGSEVS